MICCNSYISCCSIVCSHLGVFKSGDDITTQSRLGRPTGMKSMFMMQLNFCTMLTIIVAWHSSRINSNFPDLENAISSSSFSQRDSLWHPFRGSPRDRKFPVPYLSIWHDPFLFKFRKIHVSRTTIIGRKPQRYHGYPCITFRCFF